MSSWVMPGEGGADTASLELSEEKGRGSARCWYHPRPREEPHSPVRPWKDEGNRETTHPVWACWFICSWEQTEACSRLTQRIKCRSKMWARQHGRGLSAPTPVALSLGPGAQPPPLASASLSGASSLSPAWQPLACWFLRLCAWPGPAPQIDHKTMIMNGTYTLNPAIFLIQI